MFLEEGVRVPAGYLHGAGLHVRPSDRQEGESPGQVPPAQSGLHGFQAAQEHGQLPGGDGGGLQLQPE